MWMMRRVVGAVQRVRTLAHLVLVFVAVLGMAMVISAVDRHIHEDVVDVVLLDGRL